MSGQRNPILMSRTNPEGITLEDLLAQVAEELEEKNAYLQTVTGPGAGVAKAVAFNNTQIIDVLALAQAWQSDSMTRLRTLGANVGPAKPRL